MMHAATHSGRHGPAITVTHQTREHAILSVWILVTYTQFPRDELILYPLALYFAYASLRDLGRILPLLAAGWPLLLYPAWSLMSVIWAEAPQTALRTGLQVALTMMICFFAAAWLTPRRILVSVFAAASVIGLLSLGSTLSASEAARGIFQHKNVLGGNMTVLWLASLCVMLDRGFPLAIRAIAPGFAALGIFLVLHSQSATALILSCGGAAIVLSGAAFMRQGPLMQLDRLAALFLLLALGFAVAAGVSATFDEDPVDMLLTAVGRERTLTGRTDLWLYAERQIAERPWLGVGNAGFWNYETSPVVQRIFEEFHKRPEHVFTFHNSYLEITVHLGYIGLAFALLALVWAVSLILRGALARGGMPMVFLTAILFAMLVRSWVESDLLRPFVLLHMLVWIGALQVAKTRPWVRLPSPQPDRSPAMPLPRGR